MENDTRIGMSVDIDIDVDVGVDVDGAKSLLQGFVASESTIDLVGLV